MGLPLSGLRPGSISSCDPYTLEHRVDHEIDIVVVQPFGFTQDSFLHKSKPFGHSAAFEVTDGAVQDDAIAVLFSKCVIRQTCCRARDDAAALMSGIDPIADLSAAIERVDVMLSDDTGQFSIENNSEREPIVIFSLFDGSANKSRRVDQTAAVVQQGSHSFKYGRLRSISSVSSSASSRPIWRSSTRSSTWSITGRILAVYEDAF